MNKKVIPKPLPSKVLQLKGISTKTMQEHYKLYEGYVKKVNETRELLQTVDPSKGNATYSELRALKRGESYALDGVKLHELYFEQLGGSSGKAHGDTTEPTGMSTSTLFLRTSIGQLSINDM